MWISIAYMGFYTIKTKNKTGNSTTDKSNLFNKNLNFQSGQLRNQSRMTFDMNGFVMFSAISVYRCTRI